MRQLADQAPRNLNLYTSYDRVGQSELCPIC